MTVSSTTSVVQYNGNGVTKVWPIPYRFFKDTNLVVEKRTVSGTPVTLTLNSDYTVSGANKLTGGQITTTFPLDTGELLTISRVLPIEQTTDLRNQGQYFAEVHEDEFDYLTMLIQQVNEGDSRALKHPRDAEHYQAEGRKIIDLQDPDSPQDAATMGWTTNYVGNLVKTGQGPGNNAANVLFVGPDQKVYTLQNIADPIGSTLIMDGDKTVADRLKGLPKTLASQGLTGTEDGYAIGYTGSGAAGVQGNGNKFNYYEYRITSDQISQVPGTNGASGPKVNGFHVKHNFGGPTAKGGRHAIEGNLLQGYGGAGATASDNPDRNYVGVQGQALSDSGDGGTAASLKGAYFGISSYAGVLGSAKYAANLTSCEFNTYIAAGNNDRVSYHSGVQVASFIGERGYNVDAAIAISNLGGSTKGWKYGIYCHDANGKWPFDADSVFLKIQPAGTNTLDRLIDVRNVNFTTSLISAQGVDIARTGMALTGPATTVVLGDQTTNSTISIQGRSGGQGAAYDSRILFLGGGTANLQGVVQVEGAQLVSPTVRPVSDNVHSLGNASFRYSQLFASTGTVNTSDEREKENIQDLPYGLDFIEALKAVSFTWKQGAAEVKRVITGYEEKEVPVTEEYEEEYADVEIRDGVAVQVIKTRTATRNVIDTLSVVDESGNPVMETKKEVYLEEVTDADGNTSSVPATREVEVQKTITVPRMQKIQEPVYGDETTFDSGKRTHFGMIAQQVKEAMAAVGIDDFAGWTLADADNPDSRQGLRYEQFIPVLINAVKELSAQVKDLQQRS